MLLQFRYPKKLLSQLRSAQPPVIARIQENKVILDPRTVLPEQDGKLITIIQNFSKEEG